MCGLQALLRTDIRDIEKQKVEQKGKRLAQKFEIGKRETGQTGRERRM